MQNLLAYGICISGKIHDALELAIGSNKHLPSYLLTVFEGGLVMPCCLNNCLARDREGE